MASKKKLVRIGGENIHELTHPFAYDSRRKMVGIIEKGDKFDHWMDVSPAEDLVEAQNIVGILERQRVVAACGERPAKRDPMIGARIVRMRKPTECERATFGWGEDPFVVIELDTGAILVASSDAELNHPGEMNLFTGKDLYTLYLK